MIKNKDVVFISNVLADGGAARVICTLAEEFKKNGLDVGIAIYSRHEKEYSVSQGIDKEYCNARRGKLAKFKRIAWIRKICKNNPKATIVPFEYFVNMQAIIASFGLGNRVVISERNDPARVGSGPINNWVREIAYRHADMLVCQTNEAAAYFSEKVNKCVILNPIKSGLPDPYFGPREPRVVSFCRLAKQKNLEMLIQAFALFSKSNPDYTLEIYGDGNEKDHLLALINSLNLAQRAHIYSTRKNIHELIRKASMFVLPSDYEGLSNSMLESMAIGLPAICTDCPCGGARMVIQNRVNGLLVPVGDTEKLVEAMQELTEHNLQEQISEKEIETAAMLTPARIAGQWLSLI